MTQANIMLGICESVCCPNLWLWIDDEAPLLKRDWLTHEVDQRTMAIRISPSFDSEVHVSLPMEYGEITSH